MRRVEANKSLPLPYLQNCPADIDSTDLPPSVIAKPLSAQKSANSNGIFTSEIYTKRVTASKKRKRKDTVDDTPKAFQRLMAWKSGAKLPKGLDDGVRQSKKAKKAVDKQKEDCVKDVVEVKQEVPTIRVGEKMSEFSARVDQALPLSGLINKTAKNGRDPLGLKVGRTKTERKMHRMYKEWREQDVKIKEKREEAAELKEEETMDSDGQMKWKIDINKEKSGKKCKKGKKKKLLGELDDGDDDPWAQVKRNRAERKVGLNDVVLAPPTFTKVPSEKFTVKLDVPKASGSLRRREQLVEERESVVEGYRNMMKSRPKVEAEPI
ncbi:hypothetical protein BJ878DRAFT_535489 [Calycina marina]|uniref:Urease accessory protein n=1 Tax=Calycina marina TaxID=1763456 RepID=A0A9P7YZW6_9HELO|nr:hypothetical protein BJ878DRAFT_535489 [Calycina marina]